MSRVNGQRPPVRMARRERKRTAKVRFVEMDPDVEFRSVRQLASGAVEFGDGTSLPFGVHLVGENPSRPELVIATPAFSGRLELTSLLMDMMEAVIPNQEEDDPDQVGSGPLGD